MSGLIVRSAARSLLRSRTKAIVTDDAVTGLVEALERAAETFADDMAGRVAQEAASRKIQGLKHSPRMTKEHAKVFTTQALTDVRATRHRAQEVDNRNGAGIEAQ